MLLNDAQIERYSRQLILPEVGSAGQQRLQRASVLVTRCAAGAVATRYLVAAGVGRLLILTGDQDAKGAWGHLSPPIEALNPETTVTPITPATVSHFACNVIIDGSHDDAVHQQLNRIAYARRIPRSR